MKTFILTILTGLFLTGQVMATPVIGQAAPDFTAKDTKGNTVRLTDYKGKTVILEWYNHGCPYVRKHYDSGNMQSVQKDATADPDTVWLTIVSSAKGKQGYMTPDEANQRMADEGSAASAMILDPSGDIGRLFGAKTTPHMFVINAEGVLIYNGAIDDKPDFKAESLNEAENYIRLTLQELKEGKPATASQTTPYGCSVKYSLF